VRLFGSEKTSLLDIKTLLLINIIFGNVEIQSKIISDISKIKSYLVMLGNLTEILI